MPRLRLAVGLGTAVAVVVSTFWIVVVAGLRQRIEILERRTQHLNLSGVYEIRTEDPAEEIELLRRIEELETRTRQISTKEGAISGEYVYPAQPDLSTSPGLPPPEVADRLFCDDGDPAVWRRELVIVNTKGRDAYRLRLGCQSG